MDVWLFSGADRLHALTDDEEGSLLPSALGPWERLRPVALDPASDDEQHAMALIAEHGFCCFE